MRPDSIDVAIIGAGPYGLSLATHLKDKGISFRIFGQPMRTWREMPRGMFLKSFGFATNVYTPDGRDDFVTYCVERNLESNEPCAIADFARYGVWMQKRLVPDVEQVDVAEVSQAGPGFGLMLANGERLQASRLVMAVGLTHFAEWPSELQALPRELASHTSQHRGYEAFAGKDVCVVGGGQSAFEAGRLLLEAGARPRLLVRASNVSFSDKMPLHRSLWERVRRPQSVLGPSLKNWVLEKLPLLAHFVPDRWRVPFVKSHLGPHGAWWLRDRILGKVPLHTDCSIIEAVPSGGRLTLRVHTKGSGDNEITCDHVVAATGYAVDIDRLPFMSADLRAQIRRIERGPALDFRFQSSVPGLYFIGFASSLSFGPLFRFVAGAAYTSRALARELSRGRAIRAGADTFAIRDQGTAALR
jgi:cation diffusion facilitator CzcD-associated flavoprotein CzcO